MMHRTVREAVEAGLAAGKAERDKEWAGDDAEKVHVSEVGDCWRRVVMRRLKVAETNPRPARDEMARDLGDSHQERLNGHLAAAGSLAAGDRRGARLRIEDGLLVAHPDALVILDRGLVAVDWKTIRAGGFERAVREGKPRAEDPVQLNAYLGMLGMERGIVVYVNKESGALAEFPVQFSEGTYAKTRADARVLLGHILQKRPPPIPMAYAHDKYPCSTRTRDNPEGVLCQYWDRCWGQGGGATPTPVPASPPTPPVSKGEEEVFAADGVITI